MTTTPTPTQPQPDGFRIPTSVYVRLFKLVGELPSKQVGPLFLELGQATPIYDPVETDDEDD